MRRPELLLLRIGLAQPPTPAQGQDGGGRFRDVVPNAPSPTPIQSWPEAALSQAQQLHQSLSIGERDWHALKRQRPRRAAEQIAAALVQLLARDTPGGSGDPQARQQAIALLEHALAWLKAEISDPGCPSHGR